MGPAKPSRHTALLHPVPPNRPARQASGDHVGSPSRMPSSAGADLDALVRAPLRWATKPTKEHHLHWARVGPQCANRAPCPSQSRRAQTGSSGRHIRSASESVIAGTAIRCDRAPHRGMVRAPVYTVAERRRGVS